MLGLPLRRCGQIKLTNYGSFPISPSAIGQYLDGMVHRGYSKGKDKECCKEIVQTAGKKVEPWPKPDPPPPAWRCECPQDPQPPNYDPYRIKVPDVVVPPLPPSNAKWTSWLWSARLHHQQHGQEQGSPYHQHQGGYQAEEQGQEEEKDQTLLGMLKGFFDKLRGRDKRDSDSMTDARDLRLNKITVPSKQ